MMEIAPGQVLDVDLPLHLTVEATLPNKTRLTLVMVPLVDGKSADDGIFVTDVSKNRGRASIDINEVVAGQRGTIHLIATRDGVEIPISEVGSISLRVVTPRANFQAKVDGSAIRVHLLAEIYRHGDVLRLRHVGQGFDRSWHEHDGVIGTELTLDTILEVTREEWQDQAMLEAKHPVHGVEASPAPHSGTPIHGSSNLDTVPERKPRGRSRKAPAAASNNLSASDALPRMACEMLYYSTSSGTSCRIVHIVSLKDGYIWARAVDGKRVKKFTVHGVRELVDIETGEDMLPALLAAAA